MVRNEINAIYSEIEGKTTHQHNSCPEHSSYFSKYYSLYGDEKSNEFMEIKKLHKPHKYVHKSSWNLLCRAENLILVGTFSTQCESSLKIIVPQKRKLFQILRRI